MIKEAVIVADREHAFDVGEERLQCRKGKNVVPGLDVTVVINAGSNAREAVEHGRASDGIECVAGIELSHCARPWGVVFLCTIVQELYEGRCPRRAIR